MRKYLLALLAVFMGITLIGAQARAAETNFSGELRVRGEVFDENATKDMDESSSEWDTRLRLQMEFVANDNLKAVYQLEIGDITWGGDSDTTTASGGIFGSHGGAVANSGRLGTDSVNVETRHLYLDFTVPDTPLNAKAGLMPLKLGHGFVLDNDAAVLLLSANVDTVSAGAFTFKDYEDGLAVDDDTDFYGLYVNTDLPNLGAVGLFGVYARNHDGVTEADLIGANYGLTRIRDNFDEFDAYWVGLTADLVINPLTVAFEADYFNAEFGKDVDSGTARDADASGYLLYLDVGADLAPVKVGLAGLYATGNDNNIINDGDGEAFASILPTDPEDAAVVDWDNLYLLDVTGNMVSNLMSFKLYAEAAPTPELTTGLSVQYYTLVEDVAASGAGNDAYIGTEIDLDLAYNIYQQLTYEVEAAYMLTDDEYWGTDSEDIWFLSHKLIYNF